MTKREENLLNKYVADGFTVQQAQELIKAIKNHQPVFGLRASFGKAMYGKRFLKKRGLEHRP